MSYEGDVKKQMEDSDIIFTAISTSGLLNYKEAEQMIVMAYIPDESFSRAGISHALKRLERFYKEKAQSVNNGL